MIKSPLGSLAVIAIVASGCSSASKVSLGNGELKGTSAGQDAGAKQSSPGKPSSTTTTPANTTAPPDTTPPPDTTLMPDGATICGAIDTSGGIPDTDIYVMLDQSVSMADPYPTASLGSWWDVTQQGFTDVVADPAFAGLAMGLQYFPLNGVAPDSCNAHYEVPDVELAPLPGNASALTASLMVHQPVAFTPTGPALTGAISHMKEWASAHPGRIPLVLFVTDGFPTECDPQDLDDIANIARRSRDTEPPVRVGVIGLNLGAGGANLNQIAKSGGTGFARLIDSGDPETQLRSSIVSIVTSPVSCD